MIAESFSVHVVEDSSSKSTSERTECVPEYVVIETMLVAHPEEGIGRQGHTHGWVKGSTEFVGRSDAAKESQHDGHCSCDTLAITSSVSTLHHEDHTDKDESAEDFVDENRHEHGEVELVLANVWVARHWVDRGQDRDRGIGVVDSSKPEETHREHSTHKLRHPDHYHEQQVLTVVAKCEENAESDSWVEVASCDVAKEDDNGQ